MPERYASFDFHLHTVWSYDACTPVERYFELARERGVKTLAITEHHTMDSFPEIQSIAPAFPEVAYVAGAELTVSSELGTFDMVCLGLPPSPTPELTEVFERYHRWQRIRGDETSDALTAAGFSYTREDRLALLRRYRPERTIEVQGITHVQNGVQQDYLIKEKEYFPDARAFHEFLMGKAFTPYPAAETVLPAVKRSGALVFIAHPAGYFNIDDVRRMDALRELLGFDGIECAHDSVPPELTPFYRRYCVEHKLLSTAGTDSHSVAESPYRFGAGHEFGRHIGEDRWRDEILERVAIHNR